AVINIAVGYDGAVANAGKLMALVRADGGTNGFARVTGGLINDGNWHHVALTRNTSGSIELFLDGQSQGTTSVTQSDGTIPTNLRDMGCDRRWVQDSYGTPEQQYLNGSLDDMRIYNRVLSAAEVNGLAATSLVGYWKLDDGSGASAADSSGNGNTGALKGG